MKSPRRAAEAIFPPACGVLTGTEPHVRPWQFHWLAAEPMTRLLRPRLASLHGDVLDVGCGTKPYESLVPQADRYTGADIAGGPGVDVMIAADEPWALPDDSFDSLLCTQVLEHAEDPELTMSEMARVLKPGGRAVITVPFIYNEHGVSGDYLRLSRQGAERFVGRHLKVVDVRGAGAFGSTVGALVLNWMLMALASVEPGRLVLVAFLPLWLLFAWVVSAVGALVDRIDRSRVFYGHVVVIAEKVGR